MSEEAPRVFISYSHDSTAHRGKVLAFADRLRAEGIEAEIDQYEQFPPEGWNAHCAREIRRVDRVLIVCTEIYRRRWDGEEEPGRGNGVRSEANLIRNYFFEDGSESSKFIPILFDGATVAHIPGELQGLGRYAVETGDGYDELYWLLTGQHDTPKGPIGPRRVRPTRERPVFTTTGKAAPTTSDVPAAEPHPRVADLFVGRGEELEKLATLMFPNAGVRRPVVVSGMAGVGKSYFVDRFYWDQQEKFPGGYLRLSLDPEKLVTAGELIAQLADRLKLPVGDPDALRTRLLTAPSLVHIENADEDKAGRVAGELAAGLPGCAVTISARFRGLGASAGWGQVELEPFDEAGALEQLAEELKAEPRANALGRQDWPGLVAALGFLPLALHLAAGHLREGTSAAAFLHRLRQKRLALDHPDPLYRVYRDQQPGADLGHVSVVARCVAAQRRRAGGSVAGWISRGWGTRRPPGLAQASGPRSPGSTSDTFDDMAAQARRLSLLDRVVRGAGAAWRLHPLLAELIRGDADSDTVLGRMTEWFVARLPEGGDDQGRRWNELHEEGAALTEWLGRVPEGERVRVERAGSMYAMHNGPYHAWLRFCEEMLAGGIGDAERSNVLWTLGNVAHQGGLPERAMEVAGEKRTLDRDRGEERGDALAAGLIADILQIRGDLDGALRIRREEQLPVYERLGDARSAAVTKGKIADILQIRGDLDGALRIRREEELPVYERLGDARAAAVTKGKIADILETRGDLDGALRIRREEELPVYERLGHARAAAVTKGKIADILQMRGDLDGALRIRREEQLPVYERLGDARSAAVTKGQIADILQMRGDLDGALRIRREEELPVYERLGDARAAAVTKGKIADILETRGDLDGALRIRREEQLPVFERLGDARSLLIGRAGLAMTLLRRGHDGDRDEARELLRLALAEARRLQLPEAGKIAKYIQESGFAVE